MRRLGVLFATCFGAGFCPLAPGTAGAAVGIIPVIALHRWPLAYCCFFVIVFFLGVRASTVAEGAFGERDSPRIVIDEAVSMMVTLFALPLTGLTVLTGFILNRFLDIVKPFPAGRAQALKGGWGVMTDDLVAGIYSNVILRVVWAYWLR